MVEMCFHFFELLFISLHLILLKIICILSSILAYALIDSFPVPLFNEVYQQYLPFLLLSSPSTKYSIAFFQAIHGKCIHSHPSDMCSFHSNLVSGFISLGYPLPLLQCQIFLTPSSTKLENNSPYY